MPQRAPARVLACAGFGEEQRRRGTREVGRRNWASPVFPRREEKREGAAAWPVEVAVCPRHALHGAASGGGEEDDRELGWAGLAKR